MSPDEPKLVTAQTPILVKNALGAIGGFEHRMDGVQGEDEPRPSEERRRRVARAAPDEGDLDGRAQAEDPRSVQQQLRLIARTGPDAPARVGVSEGVGDGHVVTL